MKKSSSSSDGSPEWFGGHLKPVCNVRKGKVTPLEALFQRCAQFVKTYKEKVKRLRRRAKVALGCFIEARFIQDVRRIVRRLEPRYSLVLPKPGKAYEYARLIAG